MQKVINEFRLAKNLRRAGKYAAMWNKDFIKRAFINTILSQIDKKHGNSEKVMQMRSTLESRLKMRVILGFKYHLLTQNSQKMIKKKLDRMLLVKSINAFKYFSIS